MLPEITEIHQLIMHARTAAARQRIQRLAERRVPRPWVADAASLAWRAEIPGVGIRMLHPFVRPRAKAPMTATPAEQAEYAQCLVKLGAPDEGWRILESLDDRVLPRVLFYRASALASQWNHRDAIPLLLRYLKGPQVDPYGQLLGKVELAAALVHESDARRADPLLRELLYVTSLRGYELMLGRVLELAAENFIARKRWDAAESFLEQAARRLRHTFGIDEFFVREYRAIVDFHRRGGRAGLRALERLRAEAERRGYWETVRDCDHARAIETGDRELLEHLYFGTPYPNYRERLSREMRMPEEKLPRDYLWRPRGSTGGTRTLDLLTGDLDGEPCLEPGALLHRLLAALSSDFYRPMRLAALHARIYPDRFFNPTTSPPLIHDATARLRKLLRARRLPLRIVEKGGFYRLEATGSVALRVAARAAPRERRSGLLARLRERIARPSFSVDEAAKVLQLPLRSAQRFLQQAREEGELERTGKARATKYAFPRR